MYSFPNLEPVHCSMSSTNCCFLTCIELSQEASHGVWCSHFFNNFPQFVVIHTVKFFGIVNKAEVEFFWNFLAFSMIQWMLAIWSLVPLPFLNPAWISGSSQFTCCWCPAWRILSIALLECEMSAIVQYYEHFLAFPFFGNRIKIDLFQEISRQGYWRGLPFPSPGDLPNLGIKLRSPALQANSFTIWSRTEALSVFLSL